VHRDVRLAAQQALLELAREQSLAALFARATIRSAVPGGDDLQQFDLHAERGTQVRGDHFALGEGERTFAGGEDEVWEDTGNGSKPSGPKTRIGTDGLSPISADSR
jgi:hypothetical protein